MPELRAEVENGPWPSEPDEVCDLVMKGGVASGVVYPGAILALAKRYRFRNVGGTSAGAIAATVTAAAELGRREGGSGRLRAPARAGGRDLRARARPRPLPAAAREPQRVRAGHADDGRESEGRRRDAPRRRRLPPSALAPDRPPRPRLDGGVSVAGYALFLWLGWWSALTWPVLAVSAAVGVGFLASCAVILFVARPGKALARTLGDREAGFGLCPGTTQPGFDEPGALRLAPRAHPALRRPEHRRRRR